VPSGLGTYTAVGVDTIADGHVMMDRPKPGCLLSPSVSGEPPDSIPVTGTVTILERSAGRLKGSINLKTFDRDLVVRTITGTFDAPICRPLTDPTITLPTACCSQ
jgi:hypothetical protein